MHLGAITLARKQREAKLAAAFPKGVRCQKCLEYGHWSYECKGKRKYVHRSSRTQMLKKNLNKLDSANSGGQPKTKNIKADYGTSKTGKSNVNASSSSDLSSTSDDSSDSESSSSSSTTSSSSSGSSSTSSSSSSSSSSSNSSSSDSELESSDIDQQKFKANKKKRTSNYQKKNKNM
ncbi:zinc finger CCHC domain-containing protein 10-like [Sabethes cyaneus]|uniref:zinc finger CCHC domain-containing protein 10-like n=1 Tax=Sabethes cyaneus TaxID=53552 RepID=UPI00237E30E0|nr:zinc finger CCHC domain-containing protein 10-like [Sabethes cyaneus]